MQSRIHAQLLFEPTPLGEALVAAYCAMQLENLWKPDLRGVIERNITAIAQRQRRKDEVLAEGITAFRCAQTSTLCRRTINIAHQPSQGRPAGRNGQARHHDAGDCAVLSNESQWGRRCSSPPAWTLPPLRQRAGALHVRIANNPQHTHKHTINRPATGQPYVACTSRALCRTRLLLPHYTLGVQVGEPCRSCPLRTLVCRFRAALMPSGLDPETRGCVQCHATLRGVLQVRIDIT